MFRHYRILSSTWKVACIDTTQDWWQPVLMVGGSRLDSHHQVAGTGCRYTRANRSVSVQRRHRGFDVGIHNMV